MGISTLLFERGIAELLCQTTGADWVLFARRISSGFDVAVWDGTEFSRYRADEVSVAHGALKISPSPFKINRSVGFQILKNPVWDIFALGLDPKSAPQIAQAVDRLFQLAMETTELPQLTPIDQSNEVLERIQEAFYALDEDFRFVWTNSAGERLAQMTRQEMLGKRPWETHPETQESALEEVYRSAMKDGQSRVFRYYMPWEGEWVEGRVFPSPQGIAAYYTKLGHTHRLEMQRHLLDCFSNAIMEATGSLEILEAGIRSILNTIDWEHASCWTTGSEEIAQEPDWTNEPRIAAALRKLAASLPTQSATLIQNRLGFSTILVIRLNVDEFHQCVIAFARVAEDGLLWTRVLNDSLKSLEAAFQRRFAQLHMDRTFHYTPDCLLVMDSSGQMIRANPSLEFTLGFTAAQLKDMRFMELVHVDDIVRVEMELAKVDRDQGTAGFEARLRTIHGLWRWVLWFAHPMVSERFIFMTGRDITDQKAAESAVVSQTRKLRERERRLKTITSLTNDAFWDWKIETGEVWWPAEDPEFGSPTRIDEWFERIHPNDRENVQAVMTSLVDIPGSECTLMFRYRKLNNVYASVRARAVAVSNPDSGGAHVYGGFTDITAEIEFNDRLRMSEERFRLVSMTTQDAIWEWNLDNDELWWSDGIAQNFGDMESFQDWRDRLHPDDSEGVIAGLTQTIERGEEAWHDSYRFQRKDGTWAYVEDSGRIVFDSSGRAIRMVGGVVDLSEKRESLLRLQEQSLLIEQATSAISVRDLAGIVQLWNSAAAHIYGVSSESIIGKHLSSFVQYDPFTFSEAVRNTLDQGRWEGEFSVEIGGITRIISSRWGLIKHEHTKKIVAFEVDITQNRQLESQYVRAQRLESVGRLAAGIAHDLNNVLSPILMGLGTLKQGESRPAALTTLNMLEDTTLRGRDIIRQLLGYARGEEVEMKLLDLQILVQDFLSLVRESMPRSVAIATDLGNSDAMVVGDRTQIGQVLMNVCVNAADAMPNGGTLTIGLKTVLLDHHMATTLSQVVSGEYARISIADSGVGIPPDDHEHLFEPFFTTKPLGQGTGLGLPTALTIVQKHGGFINVYSEKGRGTIFHIYLPLTNEFLSEVDITSTPDILHGNGEMILVVDDEEVIRNITCQTLEAFNYKTKSAKHGAEAITIFAEHQDAIALVLTDLMMPVMDGIALIAAVQHLKPNTRVIAVSGLSANGKTARASAAGVRHFLTKPFSTEELLATLQEALYG